MQIRTMHAIDIASIVKIEQQVQFAPWHAKQFLESLDHYQCTVIELNGAVIAFCIMQPVLDEANLLLMAVDPTFQGQGYGKKILQDAIARLGKKCVQIFLEVRESNHAAIHLYEKVGFHQIDIRRNYYPKANGLKEHAIIMVNLLDVDAFDFKS